VSRTVRVGINGFGRMGRLALRAGWGREDLEFVHVNEVKGGPLTGAHLLEFDSVHGRWQRSIASDDEALTVDGHRLGWSDSSEPAGVDWEGLGVEVVLECSGRFRSGATLTPFLERGARKVVVAAPVKDGSALNVVVGVNDDRYDAAVHSIVTAASCTTNCLAPVVKVLHEGIGIRHGSITTLHNVTNTQTIVDAPHKDLRRARAAGISLIPTTTGSATAIGLIFPELQGRLDGHAVRVPLLNASLTDCVFELARETTVEEVNNLLPVRGHPRGRRAATRERRLRERPTLGDRRRPLHDGRGRNPGEDLRLVRQRVGLRQPSRRARRDRGAEPRGPLMRPGARR